MKKWISLMLSIMVLFILIVSVIFCVYGIYDIKLVLNNLKNDPSSSGIDYMGIGWGYGIGLFILATLGLILAYVSKKEFIQKSLRCISIVVMFLFMVLMIMSVGLFCV